GAPAVVRPAPEDALLAAVTPRTRLVAVSHVLWATGRKLDLERLRQPDGPPLLADGAQSAGASAVDAALADFYTVSAHKWLCGPEPSGALFVRDPERLRVALPSAFSPESHDEPDGSFVPKDGARRFDSGWIGAPALASLEAALAVHPDWRYEGAAGAAAGCRELLAPLVDVVTPADQATLVSFRPPGDPAALVAGEERLLQERVARQGEMLGVRKHRLDHLLGIALLAQDRGAVLRMLVERRVHLVVEVVQERSDSPELFVLAELPRIRGHGCLDGERVPQQRLALGVAGERLPGTFASRLHRRPMLAARLEP